MAMLILEDGSRFEGTLFGHKEAAMGEVVFTTGMCGYQQILTDPAYRGQIVVMTYPLTGNVGINDLDFESCGVQAAGLIVSELCELPSNWQLKISLEEYLAQQGVCGMKDVDTRALARHIRTHGAMRGVITEGDEAASVGAIAGDVIMEATCKEAYDVNAEGDVNIAVLDLGMKKSMTDWIVKKGAKVRVYPAGASGEEILAGSDGVIISCGPGNPNDYPQIVETVKALMGRKPVMGVGVGHLMMALACGCEVKKMLHGHHGANQPVKDLARGTCAVTSQAILYAVDGGKLGEGVTVSHVNWNDRTVEGLAYEGRDAFSVAFVPGGLGGPFDTTYLYDNFLDAVRRNQTK